MSTRARQIRPTGRAVAEYYRALEAFRAQEVEHEQAVRSALQSLMIEVAKGFKYIAIPELGSRSEGKRVVPDGTIRDNYHLPRGCWEAKDTADDLDAEIRSKIARGYPIDNMLFWSPNRAVLYQDRSRKLDVAISDSADGRAALCDVLNAFLCYVNKPILDFTQALKEFNERVPELGSRLAEIIAEAHRTNRRFKEAFLGFFELCRASLNPAISEAAVDEMLVQHLLTERLFKTVFSSPEFVRRNVIAADVEKVIDALSSRAFTREGFLASLDRFYLAIENAAAGITDFSEKQQFLNAVYERFFQGYCVKTADTHGIVYTPQPIVDFMCASVEQVLELEFGKHLGDDGVLILDPCTGTGNFIVNLMRRASARNVKHLRRMYREQLFANEIMLLPYYIAALNTEHAYFEATGQYESFDGLCFVDTLELAESPQAGLFSERNAERVERQRAAPITIVIGNPPYNVGQMVHNEQNQNRAYPVIDSRVKSTYAADSAATSVSKLNDPYVKFFRWASDRLNGRDGIVCFVSNNSFVENVAFDGMRKHLARDFQAVYHVDLEGNVRQDPKLSGTQYNVFGVQVGVGITIAVRRKGSRVGGIRYSAVSKDLKRHDKLKWLAALESIKGAKWRVLKPDAHHTWLVPPHAKEFDSFIPIGSKSARASDPGAPDVIFRDYSLGIATHRDAVVYDFSSDQLTNRIKDFIDEYNTEVDRWKRAPKGSKVDDFVRYERVSWDRDLKADLKRGRYARFRKGAIQTALYRPFVRQHLYLDRVLNGEVYGFPSFTPTPAAVKENVAICCSDLAFRSEAFSVLAARGPVDLHLCATLDGHQCFPFYVYDEDGSNRRENITDRAHRSFREHYKAPRISKWDLFHYTYALLHHAGYRGRFAGNLKRELPRLPLAPEFQAFVKAGERLMRLHLDYDHTEVVEPYKLREEWASGKPKSYRVQKMVLSKNREALIVNDSLTLRGIPADAFEYRLGNRTALDWVVDQYQVHLDKPTGTTSDPNMWGEEAEDEEYIVRLVKQVVAVSVATNEIVRSLPSELGDGLAS